MPRRYTMEELAAMIREDVFETEDGCRVEPDGICPHGYQSPLLIEGWI